MCCVNIRQLQPSTTLTARLALRVVSDSPRSDELSSSPSALVKVNHKKLPPSGGIRPSWAKRIKHVVENSAPKFKRGSSCSARRTSEKQPSGEILLLHSWLGNLRVRQHQDISTPHQQIMHVLWPHPRPLHCPGKHKPRCSFQRASLRLQQHKAILTTHRAFGCWTLKEKANISFDKSQPFDPITRTETSERPTRQSSPPQRRIEARDCVFLSRRRKH